MTSDPAEGGSGAVSSELLARRLEAAERLCDQLRHRIDALEREREALRVRLEGILGLLDGITLP